MSLSFKSNKENVFTMMPITFYAEIDLTKPNSYNSALGPFSNFF
jgi:hypothetical protein